MLDFQQKEEPMEQYLDLLAENALFAGLSPRHIPELCISLCAKKQAYPKSASIRREGDPADFIGILLEGRVQIYQDDYSGKRNIIAGFGPGTMFGEAFACAGVEELPVSILAVTDCVILFLDARQILSPTAGEEPFHQQIIRNLLQIVAEKNAFLNQKLRILSHKTTAEKLMAFLHEQARLHHGAEFTIPYDRQALADYLGVERSALSAEIGKLKAAGVLETNRSWFRLLK
jgi:CRP-like cAMP-binding protein